MIIKYFNIPVLYLRNKGLTSKEYINVDLTEVHNRLTMLVKKKLAELKFEHAERAERNKKEMVLLFILAIACVCPPFIVLYIFLKTLE